MVPRQRTRPLRPDFAAVIEARVPGLIETIRGLIEESERKFTVKKGIKGRAFATEAAPGNMPGGPAAPNESYLWEHTTHVASLTHRLARSEKTDPFVPVLAALFHDAGKFADGRYHEGSRPEEAGAAALAARVLRRAGLSGREIMRVTAGLLALYSGHGRKNQVAAIVHDADFLVKFGALGVAQFFIKSALRGQTLKAAVLSRLSKELTYAASLARNMRTTAGRQIAGRKSRETMKFFRALLRELKETRAADFTIRRVRVTGRAFAAEVNPRAKPGAPAAVESASGRLKFLDIILVLPRACEICGGAGRLAFQTEKGLKCEKLEAAVTCSGCGMRSEISFCLPEIRGA